LLALAITGGVFAYGALTGTIGGVVTAPGVFVNMTLGALPTWVAHGGVTGNISALNGTFNMTPAANFTGDFTVRAMFVNVPALRRAYSDLVLNLTVRDNVTPAIIRGSALLSLEDPKVSILVSGYGAGAMQRGDIGGGFFSTFLNWTVGQEDPIIHFTVTAR
jgi:hypothetical protein